jgi:hypothetical protein
MALQIRLTPVIKIVSDESQQTANASPLNTVLAKIVKTENIKAIHSAKKLLFMLLLP